MVAPEQYKACELAHCSKDPEKENISNGLSKEERSFNHATKLCSSANDPFSFYLELFHFFYILIMFLPKHFHIYIPKCDINCIICSNYNPAAIIFCLLLKQ